MGHTKKISNIDINDRIKQAIVLILLILIGMFISSTGKSQPAIKKDGVPGHPTHAMANGMKGFTDNE
jgi:hypothetical protein